jgi:hypothetical protein
VSEEWTSKPMTLAFIDFETKGKGGLMEGEDDFLRLSITNALKDSGRVKVVERAMLDKILQELNLSSSELANQDTKLQLGKLFSARMIATGSIVRFGGKLQVSLRLIETETSEVKVAITHEYADNGNAADIANALVKELTTKLDQAYPLRGEVAQVNGAEVVLNTGSNVGLKAGTKLRLLEEKKVSIAGKLTTTTLEQGSAEVTRVDKEVGYAKVTESKTPVKAGMKFEQIVE